MLPTPLPRRKYRYEHPRAGRGGGVIDYHCCHANDCPTVTEPRMLMCLQHWRMVPAEMQAAVWKAYRAAFEVWKVDAKQVAAPLPECGSNLEIDIAERMDAARYRWLRQCTGGEWSAMNDVRLHDGVWMLDAGIDAGIAKIR